MAEWARLQFECANVDPAVHDAIKARAALIVNREYLVVYANTQVERAPSRPPSWLTQILSIVPMYAVPSGVNSMSKTLVPDNVETSDHVAPPSVER